MRATDNFFERKREWSRLKDEILATYLRPYLSKITSTGRPVLIVDCFAGKGEFDDGEPGSPLLICRAMEAVKASRPNTEVHGLFIEKKYHAELSEKLSPFDHCEVLPGTFEQRIEDVEARIGASTNVLLFVDPYGIKSLDLSRFRHLLDLGPRSLELIMSFTTFGFLREGCRLLAIEGFDPQDDSDVYEDDPGSPNTAQRMNAVAGGSYWTDVLASYYAGELDMSHAEREFARAYLAKLGELFAHVVDIPVQYRRGNLPKYRLIHGAQNADGLILMADKMSRVWQEFVARDRGGQEALFEEIDYPDKAALEGYSLEEDILAFTETEVELKDLLIRLLTKYGITFSASHLCSTVKAMEADGRLEIRRYPERTPGGKITQSMDYRKYRILVRRA